MSRYSKKFEKTYDVNQYLTMGMIGVWILYYGIATFTALFLEILQYLPGAIVMIMFLSLYLVFPLSAFVMIMWLSSNRKNKYKTYIKIHMWISISINALFCLLFVMLFFGFITNFSLR